MEKLLKFLHKEDVIISRETLSYSEFLRRYSSYTPKCIGWSTCVSCYTDETTVLLVSGKEEQIKSSLDYGTGTEGVVTNQKGETVNDALQRFGEVPSFVLIMSYFYKDEGTEPVKESTKVKIIKIN